MRAVFDLDITVPMSNLGAKPGSELVSRSQAAVDSPTRVVMFRTRGHLPSGFADQKRYRVTELLIEPPETSGSLL